MQQIKPPTDVSEHAVKRIRQRLGLNKKTAQRAAEQAASGAPISHFSGRFRRYLDNLRRLHGIHSADYRVTDHGIFALQNGNITTVLQFPDAHKKSARRQMAEYKEQTKR